MVKIEDGEGDDSGVDDDDNIEDNEEGGGGNDIDVAEGPTKQNFCANCSPVNSSCGQLSVKHEVIFCLNPSLSHRQNNPKMPSATHEDGNEQEKSKSNNRSRK